MPEAPKEDNAPEAPAAPVEKAAEGDGEPEPVKTVSGLPHRRFTSFSISDPGEIKPIISLEKREAEMLTQERLEELWKELMYFDSLFRNYQTEILGFLREKTSNEALNYKAVVVVEQVERKAYMPREKFEAMVKVNPSMLTLRKIFPDIDF